MSAALILGPGVLAPASGGVLERVAERRAANGWGLAPGTDWQAYDVLVAPADCDHLGRAGWLVTRNGKYRALVVDCESGEHAGQMRSRRLLADVNRAELGHQMAVLVLDKER